MDESPSTTTKSTIDCTTYKCLELLTVRPVSVLGNLCCFNLKSLIAITPSCGQFDDPQQPTKSIAQFLIYKNDIEGSPC